MGLMGIQLERNKGVKLWALGDFNRVWICPIGPLPDQAWFRSVQQDNQWEAKMLLADRTKERRRKMKKKKRKDITMCCSSKIKKLVSIHHRINDLPDSLPFCPSGAFARSTATEWTKKKHYHLLAH